MKFPKIYHYSYPVAAGISCAILIPAILLLLPITGWHIALRVLLALPFIAVAVLFLLYNLKTKYVLPDDKHVTIESVTKKKTYELSDINRLKIVKDAKKKVKRVDAMSDDEFLFDFNNWLIGFEDLQEYLKSACGMSHRSHHSHSEDHTASAPSEAKNPLEAYYASKGLQNYCSQMEQYVRNAVKISYNKENDAYIPVGSSKYGGCPDMPKDAAWPTNGDTGAPLSFICQFNLAQTRHFDKDKRLPEHGMLYLFYGDGAEGMRWGYEPGDACAKAVIFADERTSSLCRRDTPQGATEYRSAVIFFEHGDDLPHPDSHHGLKLHLSAEEAETLSRYIDARAERRHSKLLGHSDNIQGDMESECALVGAGVSCATHESRKAGREQGLDLTARDWSLLMQIDSYEDLGMMWGDEGKLYVWIREEDLKARRFDRSWLILQCG